MKIAVTGAGGFIGQRLVNYLAGAGHEVRALCHRPQQQAVFAEKVETVLVDVRERDALTGVFSGIDVVMHLAALFNHPDRSREDYFAVNVEGAENVIRAAREAGVSRVVHCSTVGVTSGGEPPYSESDPYNPPEWDSYETSKSEGEQRAIALHHELDYPIMIIRPGQVYGPGDESKVKFYKMVKKGVIVSPGETLKHLIHVDDLCVAFERAATAESGFAEPIIIANEEPIRLRKLISMAAKALGVPEPKVILPTGPVLLGARASELAFRLVGRKSPIHRRSMNFFTKSVSFKLANARRHLDFSAAIPLEIGLEQTVAWLRESGRI